MLLNSASAGRTSSYKQASLTASISSASTKRFWESLSGLPDLSTRVSQCQYAQLPERLGFFFRPKTRAAISSRGSAGNSARQPTGSKRIPSTGCIELRKTRGQQSFGHLDLHRVVFKGRSVGERDWHNLFSQFGRQRLSLEKILHHPFPKRAARDPSEDDPGILNGVVWNPEADGERGHRKIPNASRAQFFNRSPQAGRPRSDRHVRNDFVVENAVRMHSSALHHVPGDELLDRKIFDSGGGGEFHPGI